MGNTVMGKNATSRAERRRAEVVARAAAVGGDAGAGTSAEVTSRRKFLSVVASVILIGTLAVGYVWADRQYEHPTVLDSWQNAYAIFDCQTETWLAPFDSRANPDGIRSRGDGIIYIEPATEAAAGDNATLDLFLDAMGAQLSDDRLELPDGIALEEQGTFCDGEEAVLQVRRWAPGAQTPSEIRFTELAEVNFLADLESLAIVFAPVNAELPIPPTSADLPDPRVASVAAGYEG